MLSHRLRFSANGQYPGRRRTLGPSSRFYSCDGDQKCLLFQSHHTMDYTPQLRSLYRRLIRELPLRPAGATKLSAPSPLQRQIRDSLIKPSEEKPLGVHVAELEQFVQYARAQRMYTTLLERYNPGMNMSEEDRVRLTARRVGMDLPVEREDKD